VIPPSWTALSTWKPDGTKAEGRRLQGMALIPSRNQRKPALKLHQK
jgi:hypothetical protein